MLPLTPRQTGIVLVSASAIAWSTTGLFTRAIALDGATMLVWRGIFGALGLSLALIGLHGAGALRGYAQLGRAGWLYAAVSAAGMLCFISALRLTSVAHVAIIYAVAPFLAAGLGWVLLREAPSRAALLASALALIGALIMVGFGREGGLIGDLLALGMTTAMALMMVISRRTPGIPTLPAAAVSALLSAAVALPFSQGLGVPLEMMPLLVAFGLVNSALGLALFLLGSARIAPVETALIGALDAPLAPIWVWLIFAETPSSATLIGASIVLVAVIGHIWASNRRPA